MKKILFFSALILILFNISCQKKYASEQQKPVKIIINWAGEAYTIIAAEKGMFKKNNVKVEIEFVKDYNQRLTLYKEGKCNGIGAVLADFVMLNAQGYNSKLIYSATFSDSSDAIIAKSDIKSIKDLKGKMISFDGVNTFSHYFVLEILKKAGLSENDVNFANVNSSNVLNKLENNEIDAGHCWTPTQNQAVKKGYKILAKAGDYPGVLTDVFFMNSDFVDKNEETVRRIIKSFSEARDFIYKNPEETIDIVSKYMNQTPAEMKEDLSGIYFLTQNDNINIFNKKNEINLYNLSAKIAQFFINRGQISKMPDFEKLIDGRLIN